MQKVLIDIFVGLCSAVSLLAVIAFFARRKARRLNAAWEQAVQAEMKRHGDTMYRQGVKDTYMSLADRMQKGMKIDDIKFIEKKINEPGAGSSGQ